MMHNSDWEAAALIGRYKRNRMGSSRTNEIEVPHVQVGLLSRINYSGIDRDVVR